ncbi:MAG TPA: ABC transporter permease [Vicinamibacterales bacterium]|nr:ABC transporter permease [Vicinamibacterales bacterium]
MTARLAAALARALLLLYPPSFRREMGDALVDGVRRRAQDLARGDRAVLRSAAWLVKLSASLVVNAVAAWAERVVAFPSRLDLKLALRMLVKYPGLTLVGGLGIAVAVAIGVGFFAIFHARFYPDVPLPDGDRLVALENWNRRTHQEARRALADFTIWRDAMTTVEDVTAFHDVTRNVTGGTSGVEAAQIAEITPSGFRLARVPPLLGRVLVDADAQPGAPPVIVIGAEVWRSRFNADANAINARLELDTTAYTIVGVMPDGFAFPVNHRYWIPMTIAAADREPGRGPSIFVAGRLAPGRDAVDAQAELTAVGQRLAAAYPDTHADLRPEVLPYTYPFAGMSASSSDAFWPVSALVSLILVVVSVNVAILVYARTATRVREIAIRSALGASRGRIVAQLSAESFVLSAGAAIAGVLLVKVALDWVSSGAARLGQTNFWTDYSLSRASVVYAGALAALAVVLTGVVPALRATGCLAQRSGLHLGRTWTTLIVVQISIASAALPAAIGLGWFQVRDIFNLPRFPVDQILFAEATLDQQGADLPSLQARLSQRLDAEPAAVSHTFAMNLPNIGRSARIAIENDSAPAGASHQVQPSIVGPDFFRTFDVSVLAGRPFASGDFIERADRVVVNRAFARRLLAGTDALGRRIRLVPDTPATAPSPWLEIVGVVENIDWNPFGDDLAQPRIYQPLTSWEGGRIRLAVRMPTGERAALARALPDMGAAIAPALQVKVVPLEDVYRFQRVGLTAAAGGIAVAVASVVLLSAAGIFAMMSFTVTQRRREIAIRTALGAAPARLLGGIFRRALRQIAAGIVIGAGVALLIDYSSDGEMLASHAGVILPSVVLVMSLAGLAATTGPARRGLRIEPVEALKSE